MVAGLVDHDGVPGVLNQGHSLREPLHGGRGLAGNATAEPHRTALHDLKFRLRGGEEFGRDRGFLRLRCAYGWLRLAIANGEERTQQKVPIHVLVRSVEVRECDRTQWSG